MKPPFPILFTIPNFITAGSGQVLFNIISRLDPALFAPAVCVMRKGGHLDAEIENLGFLLLEHPFTIKAKPYASLLWRAWQTAQAFRPFHFALWHSWSYVDDYTEPIIARFAASRAWLYTKKAMTWGTHAWKLRSVLATRIIADNSEMSDHMFAPLGLARKVRVIPHGIPTSQYQPEVASPLHLRQSLGIDPNQILIGCAAHLVPVKGHPTLLRAVASVPHVHLLLAGNRLDSDYNTKLERLVADLHLGERVHFLGHVQDIPAFLSALDIVVLATERRGEGCPVALLEAMACARACIATDVPGSRDLIEHEKCGLLVPPEDAEAMAAAIRRLVAAPDLRHRFGAAARNRVLLNYTIEKEVAAYEALYSEILGLA